MIAKRHGSGTDDSKGTSTLTPEATFTRFREYMVGPSRFMSLLSCFELGVIDKLRDTPGMTAAELGDAVGAKPDAVEQLLLLLVKESFLAYDEDSGGYSLDALADIPENDLRQVLARMEMIKAVTLRQLFYLTDSVRTGTTVGLNKLYGHEGNLYGALAEHKELREPWARLMNGETAHIDPWFFDNIDVPPGSKVLDLAGNTGLGAIHTCKLKASPGLRVTTFDLPEKEEECLENFRSHGLEEQCSFIGGDVFEEVPKGFDVVLIKHFLPMFDKSDVFKILEGVNRSMDAGGQVHLLVPVFPENIKDTDNYTVDFFPSFFIGCAMGQGGAQKMSTWQKWLEECGFTVTKAIAEDPADMLPHALPVEAVLSATKRAG
ncbi:methyltransferase [Streptomyces phytophilus]|uniref:methyltransferase n=1 Tax=Streptomyces phytophilus TaxID=722715 RepID=UPI00403ECEE3